MIEDLCAYAEALGPISRKSKSRNERKFNNQSNNRDKHVGYSFGLIFVEKDPRDGETMGVALCCV